MRLGRLELIRYGHFTDWSFDLPASKTDFHIIFGPNEAGKSTALAAVGDLLFGMPTRSPYNFFHDYGSMRIGAVLENDGASLAVLRRKGNKDTLLRPDGSPVPVGESLLAPYLAGADRSFFERMFGLDHMRLEAGGREILQARDDVGQMLFSAGAGIGGLRKTLGKLDSEADGLWSARRAKHRKFYIASDKLGEARKALREHRLTAANWLNIKREHEEVEETFLKLDRDIKERTAQRNRLSRIRRVLRDVRRKQVLDRQIAELGDAVSLPEDSAEVVAEAERKEAEAVTSIETLQQQLERAENELKELSYDETLVLRAEDIRQFHERRIEIRSEKADLPKREAELNAAEQELCSDAQELGWTETDANTLIKRIPTRAKVAVARGLLGQKGELEVEVANRNRLLEECRSALDHLQKRLDETSDPADGANLAIVIRTVREQGDIAERVRSAEKNLRIARQRVQFGLEKLKPGVAEEQALLAVAAPASANVQAYRDQKEDWKRRLRETKQRILSIRQKRDAAAAALKRALQDEQVVTPEALGKARGRRDALWGLVKIRHVDGESIPKNQTRGFEDELADLTGAFESAMTKTDQLADRIFTLAEAAGQVAEIQRNIGELESQLEQARETEAKLGEEGDQLQAAWSSMWAAAPFEPGDAESMLEWLDVREEVLTAIAERMDAEVALATSRDEESAAKQQVLCELAASGMDSAALENDGLNVIVERAAEELRQQELGAERKVELTKNVQAETREVVRRERELRQANEALDEWRGKWAAALGELGLPADTAPEAVGSQIDTIDHMRGTADRIGSLRRDRIDKINRDVADFEQLVEKLARELTEDLERQPAEHVVLELEKRLANAERMRELRAKTAQAITELTAKIRGIEDKQRESAAAVVSLKQAANVETGEALKEVIALSDRKRTLTREREQVIEKLLEDGDGNTVTKLEDECKDALIDDIVAQDASIQAELEELRMQQNASAEKRSQAREAFQAIGGGDAAAQAAASQEEALTEMREVAERYARARTSAILLRWAIERYRREKQAPLLRHAGALFKAITKGSFASLEVAFDDQDNAFLTGARPDGSIVPVSGMSSGTADQLYLALRVAAIEDYLARADALPFVADDLFINFDDDRAAAGLELLGELSKQTQVMFFTHHRHLVGIARKTLGDSVNVIRLADPEAAKS